MAQLDNPKSIALLFTGAFFVGIGVIAFLNVEMQSRSTHGTKIRNESVLKLLGKKISETISGLKERNAHRRSLLYQILISGNTTSSPRRKLLYFLEKSDKLDEMLQQRYQNKTPHRVRHEKKIRRLTEIQVKEKTNSSSRRETNDISDVRQETTIDDNIRVFLKSVNNKTMKWFKWSENATKNGSTNLSAKDQVLHEKLEVHQNCYTMNDVLEIIAVTCLVNFIFWFMIITCVNVFTRNQKISKSDSCESLASVDSCSEHEPPTGECKKLDETSPRTSLCRHSFVQDYVNSLIMEAAENGGVNPGEVQYLHHHQHQHRHYPYPNEKETDVGDEYSRNKCDSRARFIHFPNIFLEMISLDNVKPFGKKKRGLRDKPANAFNSFSMENLIF